MSKCSANCEVSAFADCLTSVKRNYKWVGHVLLSEKVDQS